MRILLVEDDSRIARFVSQALREQAYAVDATADGDDALYKASVNDYDAVILDLMIPGRDGFEVCRELRAAGSSVPVIMLTARDAVPDRVAGFDAGGDDYVIKPFALGELAERVRALLRRSGRRQGVEVGGLRLDSVAHAVVVGDAHSTLTPIEFRVLSQLLNRPGQVVRRRSLATAGWPDGSVVLDNTLDACVSRLRKKLAALGATVTIDTVHGVGYRIAV